MKSILIVTRHSGMVEWFRQNGVEGDVSAHATPENVTGKVVYGILPLHLAALAASVTTVDMPNLPPEFRGKELTPQQMNEFGAVMKTYEVRSVN